MATRCLRLLRRPGGHHARWGRGRGRPTWIHSIPGGRMDRLLSRFDDRQRARCRHSNGCTPRRMGQPSLIHLSSSTSLASTQIQTLCPRPPIHLSSFSSYSRSLRGKESEYEDSFPHFGPTPRATILYEMHRVERCLTPLTHMSEGMYWPSPPDTRN